MKHHHSFKSMDCTTKLCNTIFDDSTIAKNLSTAKTKTEAIVTNVIAPYSLEIIQKQLDVVPHISISTDASNHGNIKMFPIAVQYFTKESGLQIKLIDLQQTTNETSATISTMLLGCLQKHGISSKCVAFGGDNCNTNFGGLSRKSSGENVFAHLKASLPSTHGNDLIGVGCPAHILHNTIQRGSDSVSVDVEVIIMKLFSFFSIYTVRVAKLADFCEYVDVEYKNLLSHSKTRWLSLSPALDRLVTMFEPLKFYFQSLSTAPTILVNFFSSQMSLVYLSFLQSQMSLFHASILQMERKVQLNLRSATYSVRVEY